MVTANKTKTTDKKNGGFSRFLKAIDTSFRCELLVNKINRHVLLSKRVKQKDTRSSSLVKNRLTHCSVSDLLERNNLNRSVKTANHQSEYYFNDKKSVQQPNNF